MKKIMMLSATICCACFTYAQKIKTADVPSSVKTAFIKQYPNVKATWEKEDDNFEAGFKYNGHEMSCVIDVKGNIMETETEIKETELPATIKSYVKAKGNPHIQEAAKILYANGTVEYEARIKGKDWLFDSNGKFIKTVND